MRFSVEEEKKREELSFEDAICKGLGWFFPLMAKFKVADLEELIFRKYPYACPYCRETPHAETKCKTVIGTKRSPRQATLTIKNPTAIPGYPFLVNDKTTPLDIRVWNSGKFEALHPFVHTDVEIDSAYDDEQKLRANFLQRARHLMDDPDPHLAIPEELMPDKEAWQTRWIKPQTPEQLQMLIGGVLRLHVLTYAHWVDSAGGHETDSCLWLQLPADPSNLVWRSCVR